MPSSLSRAVIATEPASYTAGGFQAPPPPAVAACTARCGALPSGLAFHLACCSSLPGEVIDCFKVDLADSDQRHGVDLIEIDWRRDEQPRQPGIGQSLHQLVGRLVERGMDHNQTLAGGFIRHGSDHGSRRAVLTAPGERRQRLFDRGEWDLLAANLGKAALATDDGDEPILIDGHDVAGVVPAVLEDGVGQILLVQIAQHHVRPGYPQHAAFARFQHGAGLRVADFDPDAPRWASDGSLAQDRAGLTQRASGWNVGGDDRTQLSGAIALEGTDPELALERIRNRLR